MTKEQLRQIRREFRELKELREDLEQFRAGLLPGAIRYDLERVQASPCDRQAERIIKANEMQENIALKLWDMTDRFNQANEMISRLTDSCERQVLRLYYLNANCYTMEDVAQIMCYSRRQTYRMRDDALDHIQEISKK